MDSAIKMVESFSNMQGNAAEPALSVKPRMRTGIFPCQAIREMVRNGEIIASDAILPDQIQPASIDLRLGAFAYPMETSFLPGKGMKVLEKMAQLDPHFEQFKIDLGKGEAVLEKGKVYVIPLLEAVHLKSEVSAFANPKSSTGRLDILTRLIADETIAFDQVEEGYRGQLYVEVIPRSFSVVVKTGTRLNQLRFSRTRGEAPKPIPATEWWRLIETGQIIDAHSALEARKPGERSGELLFTVDLKGSGREGAVTGWRARKYTRRIDLGRRDYNAGDFWEPIHFHKSASLVLEPDEFYILMTKEAIAVPPDFAAEMLPYDTRSGEFRVHYAGFFDPGFGWNPESEKAGSSRGVLEVRSHDVPFLLEDGQVVGRLRYERMAARPEKLYGHDSSSHYQNQGLKLAKQFLPFPGETAFKII